VVFLRHRARLFLPATLVGGLAGTTTALLSGGDTLLSLGCASTAAAACHVAAQLVTVARQAGSLPPTLALDRRWWLAAFSVLCVGLHGYCLFTNSFVEAEEVIVRYLLSGLLAALALTTASAPGANAATALLQCCAAVACVRLSAGFGQGRHEAHFPYSGGLAATAYLLQACAAAALPAAVGLWSSARQRGRGLLAGAHVALTAAAVLCTCAYWLLLPLPQFDAAPVWAKDVLPRAVYAASLGNVALIVLAGRAAALGPRQLSRMLLTAFAPVLGLVLGSWSALALALMLAEAALALALLRSALAGTQEGARASVTGAALWALVTLQFYFATGHHWQFSCLQFEAAYIGFEEFNYAAGGAAVLCNTFAAAILAAASLPLLKRADGGAGASASLAYFAWFCFDLALTSVFVFVERRHLMVWRVFAPKFMFSASLVAIVAVLVIASEATQLWWGEGGERKEKRK